MTLVLAFVVMLVVVLGMAAGVLMGREPIRGSCGGLGRLGLGECEICGGDPAKCEAPSAIISEKEGEPDLGYDATQGTSRRFDA